MEEVGEVFIEVEINSRGDKKLVKVPPHVRDFVESLIEEFVSRGMPAPRVFMDQLGDISVEERELN